MYLQMIVEINTEKKVFVLKPSRYFRYSMVWLWPDNVMTNIFFILKEDIL